MGDRDEFDFASLLIALAGVAVLFFMIWTVVSFVTSFLGHGAAD